MAKKLYKAIRLNDNDKLSFVSDSAEKAMNDLIWFLNLKGKDPAAKIETVEDGKSLILYHNGSTWKMGKEATGFDC